MKPSSKFVIRSRIKLIVVDGIFSMEGDIVKLPEVVKLAEKYDASIMIDDAHSIGVLGQNGSGTASHFGLIPEVDLIMGTFSKSACLTRRICGIGPNTSNYLKHNSRFAHFSASMTPAGAEESCRCLCVNLSNT
ncbi:MAG: aminotransferase class I/II-fold pyridoxal phosphate-dependent enzyme [Chromatiales bacterium]|nr:aminotransferase class I/II-fold pyridoxal phosphate-dependent enzyme [Chromatiales bacterium]